MISWGPSVRPLLEAAEYGGRPGPEDRGFLITLDGIVPLGEAEQDRDPFDLGPDQDRFEH